MDNGFRTATHAGRACDPGETCYSTVPILQVDESAKTATILFRDTIRSGANFAVWGGGTTPLANGNLEFDLCGEPNFSFGGR